MRRISKFILPISFFVLGIVLGPRIISLVKAHGGDANLIHGCIRPLTGLLRIIGANDNCGANETPLDWQQFPEPGTDFNLICAPCELSGNFQNKLSGKDLRGAIISNSTFSNINLSNTNLSNSIIAGTTFDNANMSQSDISNSEFSQFILNSNFSDINAANVAFGGSMNIVNSDFAAANLQNSVFLPTSSTIIDSNFTEANFTGADTSGITLWQNTICPDGTNSNDHGQTCEGHLTP